MKKLLTPLLLGISLAGCGGSSGDATEVGGWFAGPDFELAGIWSGTTTDNVTSDSNEAFLFTSAEGDLILASKESVNAEGTVVVDGYDLKGNVVAEPPPSMAFADGSTTTDCTLKAEFESQMEISGTYTCANGTQGAFAVSRISPLTADAN
jgi:hypothetical protein